MPRFVVLAFAFLIATNLPALANRCSSGLTNGVNCQCPDYAALLGQPNGPIQCDKGFTPVIYGFGQPFPPDTTSSHVTIRGAARSPCAGLVLDVPFDGQIVGCWGPLKNGCREFRVPFNGVCLHLASMPLGAGCTGTCSSVTTEQVAIGTAGSASFSVCAPIDPATSCRGTNVTSTEIFRFQTGGLCDTYDCEGGAPGPQACVKDWGASYWGFQRPRSNPAGWYDWQSGAFKLILTDLRPTCGAFNACVGSGKAWDVFAVGTPAGSAPPCQSTDPSAPCNPASCMP